VADSLDDSRQQKISKLELALEGNRLLIYAHASDDLVLEKWAFQRKNKLFTDVYGLQPELIAKGDN
jgi:exopolyphosphatase / guanosine-5'-triphosphate,3'-diphosphate pyrophosphatase